jgi:hypothetical protein
MSRRRAGVVEVAQVCQMNRTSASADGQKSKLETPRAMHEATLTRG